ncbi:inositol 2-dehydrogenase [Bacillus sp. 165]|uniref:inositol 2-dehydrogenase n=1 Tax=Bacillus sp. 165 TaxID=1529117 RepID=UPI001ADAF836|nr:inositol 2-dehydrogenase [Bacillus sp. 165]MBO9128134.1 inositol 2-dehydrogenase [Bacillus sp. 165]
MKLTIGIIGAGRIGKIHAGNLRKIPQVRVKSISDVVIDHLDEWAQETEIEVVTADYQDILNDPEIHAVFICTPTTTHANLIIEAAAAGKHIFCEKPVSFSVKETKSALEAVQKAGVKLQVGFNRRFDFNFRKIQEVVQSGEIGTPHILRITSRDPQPPSIDYIKTSGGIFMDMTIHDFDMARYIMNSEVVEVYVNGAVLVNPAIGEAGDIDTAVISLKFANGALGVIDNSRSAVYGYDQRLEIFGNKGAAQADNNRANTVEISNAQHVTKEKPLHFFLERYAQAYFDEAMEFINAILENKEVSCSGIDGLQAELIAQAARTSLETGAPIQVQLVGQSAATV